MNRLQQFLAALTNPIDADELADLRDQVVNAAQQLRTLTGDNARLTARVNQLRTDLVDALYRAETAENQLAAEYPDGTREAIRVAHHREIAEHWQAKYLDEHAARTRLAEQVAALQADNAQLRATARGTAA